MVSTASDAPHKSLTGRQDGSYELSGNGVGSYASHTNTATDDAGSHELYTFLDDATRATSDDMEMDTGQVHTGGGMPTRAGWQLTNERTLLARGRDSRRRCFNVKPGNGRWPTGRRGMNCRRGRRSRRSSGDVSAGAVWLSRPDVLAASHNRLVADARSERISRPRHAALSVGHTRTCRCADVRCR